MDFCNSIGWQRASWLIIFREIRLARFTICINLEAGASISLERLWKETWQKIAFTPGAWSILEFFQPNSFCIMRMPPGYHICVSDKCPSSNLLQCYTNSAGNLHGPKPRGIQPRGIQEPHLGALMSYSRME